MPESVSSTALPAETTLETDHESTISQFTACLAKGEESSWADFYQRYRPRLLGYLSRAWHGSESALDDLLQETLLRAVRHMRVFPSEDALWSWLAVLARSVVADRGRRHSRWRRFLVRWRLESELRAIPATAHSSTQRLEAALTQLDDHARTLIEAKYTQGQSIREIAARWHTTEKAIERRLSRARKKLAQLLRKHTPPTS